jgi:hypothetical protein
MVLVPGEDDDRQPSLWQGGTTRPEPGPLPDLSPRGLIDVGIVAADGRGSTIDHLTAWRLSIWLAAQHILRR